MRGSLWVALTAECFDDIMKLTTPSVERCLKGVFCPDEMYFHTMIAATRHASDNAAGGVEPYPGRPASLITTSTSSTIHSTSSSPSTTST